MSVQNTELLIKKTYSSGLMDAALAQIFVEPVRRVLLVAPPEVDAGLFVYETGARGRYTNLPPYGLAVLAAHLRRDGLEVEILNLNQVVLKACRLAGSRERFDFDAAWKAALADSLAAKPAQFIGVTSMFDSNHRSLVNICTEIDRLAPATPLAVGGVHITLALSRTESAEPVLQSLPMVDLFFVNECDRALSQFFDVVHRQRGADELAQVYVRSDKGLLFASRTLLPAAELLSVLPAHDLIDPTDIRKVGTIGGFGCHLAPADIQTVMQSNRGCRAQCSFCGVRNINGKGVRRRSVTSVLDELQYLHEKVGVNHVTWLDDDFLYDKAESMALFNGMVARNLRMTWDCSNGVIAASCTEEVVHAAAQAGCIGLILGLESGSPRILRQIKKPGTVDRYLQAAEVFQRHPSIDVRGFLMLGFPDETFAEIMQTFSLGRQMGLNWYNISTVVPVPGTPIFDAMIAAGSLKQIDFENMRLRSGPYANHAQAQRAVRDPLSIDFKNAFAGKDMNTVPTAQDLDDIWAYMQYHLNFQHAMNETSSEKIGQLTRYLQTITDLIAPENAIALYCLGQLQQRTHGQCDAALVPRLLNQLDIQPYWKERFADFGFDVDEMAVPV